MIHARSQDTTHLSLSLAQALRERLPGHISRESKAKVTISSTSYLYLHFYLGNVRILPLQLDLTITYWNINYIK
jgi:hypothetical protein